MTEQNVDKSELASDIGGAVSPEATAMTTGAYDAPPPSTPEGWHTDPRDATLNRFWNGSAWTDHTSPKIAPPGGNAPLQQTAKTTGTAYLLAILLGAFAAHRFYLGRIGSAFAFLGVYWVGWAMIGFGGTVGYIGLAGVLAIFVLWIVDLVRIPKNVREVNARLTAVVPSS